MKLRLTLILFFLLGIGAFSNAQSKKKVPKPKVENVADEIPVTVMSIRHRNPPPPPKVEKVKFTPPRIVKDKPNTPPPKPGGVKFAPPKIVKDKQNAPPPPPAPKQHKEKLEKPDAPPPADFRG